MASAQQPTNPLVPPPSPTLSVSHSSPTLAAIGEERTADAGEVLYQVGDRDCPFMAIIEGEAAILDAAGDEIVRHGPSGFLGELNLLSAGRCWLRRWPLHLCAIFTIPIRGARCSPMKTVQLVTSCAVGVSWRASETSSASTASAWRSLDHIGPRRRCGSCHFSRAGTRLAFTWRDPEHADDPAAAILMESLDEALPHGGQAAPAASNSKARPRSAVPGARHGRELAAREEADLLITISTSCWARRV